MALKINFNEAAAKTHTMLISNEYAMGKSLLRLSTGLKILNAADDSAGLFIADMLGTVAKAYEQGNRNIQTGISALQIAEAAAGKIYDKLQDIYVRAQNAANDINDINARQALQREINNFVDVIEKIGTDTEYNGIKLLDGTFTNKAIHYGPRENQVVTLNVSSLRALHLGAYISQGTGSATSGTGAITSLTGGQFVVDSADIFTIQGQNVRDSSTNVLVDAKTIATNINSNTNLQQLGITATARNSSSAANPFTSIVSTTGTVTNINLRFFIGNANVSTPTFSITGLNNTVTLQDLVNRINSAAAGQPITASIENGRLMLRTSNGETIGLQVEVSLSAAASFTINFDQLIEGATAVSMSAASGTAYAVNVGDLTIAGVETFSVNTTGMNSLGISSGAAPFRSLNQIDVTTNTGAETSIIVAAKALQKVDTIRAQIGATMNNLKSIFDSQKVAYDNTKEAESLIRNTDYAKEMAEFTTYQIRMQATIAMLGQANTLPQLVLQLLR